MLRTASFIGFLAVVLGAFGAHVMHDVLIQNETLEAWKTASLYHLVHALVLLVLALALPKARWAFYSFTGGILIFSGSLYLLALSNIKWLGAITPLGGLALLAGWLLLALKKN
jgi:uncharacterized membrane protein YgdD (TMEM256/DUF423 family)